MTEETDPKQQMSKVFHQWRADTGGKLTQQGSLAEAIIAAGWVSPEEHHETLNDYGQAVGDLNLANYRLARVREAWRTWPQVTLSVDDAAAQMRRLWELLRVALNSVETDGGYEYDVEPHKYATQPAEPAPTKEAEPEPNTRVVDAIGHRWHRTEGCRRWHNDSVRRSECLTWDELREHSGPLTVIERRGR